jgi:hypothetical protein
MASATRQEVGDPHGYLARLEIGMHDPSVSTLAELAKAPKVKAKDLLE